MDVFAKIRTAFAVFQLRTTGRWMVFGVAVGIVGGLAASAFNWLLALTEGTFLRGLAHIASPPTVESGAGHPLAGPPVAWLIVLLPAFGGLVSGLLVSRFAPEAEGHGTDSVIAAFHRRRGVIRGRVPIVKLLASTAVIGTGGSAGREGPVVQTAAGFASVLAGWLKLTVRERRLLVIAGMGAGVGGMFRAPLGGALFAVEVLYRSHEIESEGLIPAAFGSIIAYLTTLALGAPNRLFETPPIGFASVRHVPAYLILAIVLAITGVVWVRWFYFVRDVFRRLPLPAFLKPALGGLCVGALALALPQILGGGYGYMQQAINGTLKGLALFLVLASAKIVATSLSVGSGGSGGVFAPSLYIGAMVSGAVASALGALLPASMVPEPGALVLVGMGGFFAGVAKVPVTSLILASEMTGDYNLFLPMLLVSAINFLATGALTIYEAQPPSVARSPAHEWEFRQSILDGARVADAEPMASVDLVHPETRLKEIVPRVLAGRQHFYPIVGPDGKFLGGFTLDTVRAFLLDGEIGEVVVAQDIALSKVTTLAPDEDLHAAITKLSTSGGEELPVVSPDGGRFLGLMGRRQIIAAYERRLAALNEAREGKESA